MNTRLLLVHALSPLHAGTGQSQGTVDLAIARDRATDLPYLPGSSLKGSLRDVSRGVAGRDERRKDRGLTLELFGPETTEASDHRGGALFGDANLLLLPVRSVKGTFAWVTSPYLLHRFARDLADVYPTFQRPALEAFATTECLVTHNSDLTVSVGGSEKVIFEDLDLTPKAGPAKDWFEVLKAEIFPGDDVWKSFLDQRFCIVSDELMTFLARHGTAVVARVALKPDTKTVDHLWHEESLPPETILHSLVHVAPVPDPRRATADELLAHLKALTHEKTIQLGGKATVGRGRCRLVLGGA